MKKNLLSLIYGISSIQIFPQKTPKNYYNLINFAWAQTGMIGFFVVAMSSLIFAFWKVHSKENNSFMWIAACSLLFAPLVCRIYINKKWGNHEK